MFKGKDRSWCGGESGGINMNWRYALNRYATEPAWRVDNPFSILTQFDLWFQFECWLVGFRDEPPDIRGLQLSELREAAK